MNCPSCNTPLHVQSDGQLIHPKADACAFSLVGLYPAGWEAVYGVKRAAFAEAACLAEEFPFGELENKDRPLILLDVVDRDREISKKIRAMAAPEQKENA